jgi:steroid delta-isomerase-like uncharacterized protein
MTTPEQNKAFVREVFAEMFNRQDLSAADRYYAEGFFSHNPSIPPGREGFKQGFGAILAAFPDLHGTIEDMLAEGDRVMVRVTWTGTHRGPFIGFPPTGQALTFHSVDILRFENGKIAEHWDCTDFLDALARATSASEQNKVGEEAPPTGGEDDVDPTLIRWMLSLTPIERLRTAQQYARSAWKLRHAPRRV